MLRVYKNKKAQEGEPLEWVNLRELWLKVGYKIPYNRWVKYMVKNQHFQPRIKPMKHEGAGRPAIHYFVPVEAVEKLVKIIQARKQVEIHLVRDKEI